jgi:hypothetical protein
MKVIKREIYLKRIRPYYGKQVIKILTGQRRVGKSFLLKQIATELNEQFPLQNLIFIDKEQFIFDEIRDYSQLYSYIKEHANEKMNTVLIDEIQEIKSFEKALRSLLSEGNFDIYCTGSNSDFLSGNLATILSGRQVNFTIHSLTFKEFTVFHKLPKNNETLEMYIKYGGLPYLMHLPKEDLIIFDYLKNINATILYRDILSRYEIRDVGFLSNMVHFLANNTGSITVAKRISDYMKSQGDSKTVSVILNYLQYLKDAFLITFAPRYDIQGKKIFEQGGKYYFQDHGLRNAEVGYNVGDIGKLVENCVFNHLLTLGFKVYVGVLKNLEIDFIAEKQGEKIYFQACYLLADEKVIEREFGNLLRIKDQYPKYVISMDTIKTITSYEGIRHLTLLEFLQMEL